jgi:hypothetical protein
MRCPTLLLILLVFWPSFLNAQTQAAIRVQVRTGAEPVADADVIVNGTTHETTADGRVTVPIAPGVVSVTVMMTPGDVSMGVPVRPLRRADGLGNRRRPGVRQHREYRQCAADER